VAKKSFATVFCFQKLTLFPKRNRVIVFSTGKNTLAERKMLSSESMDLSRKAKRREHYEEQ